MSEQTPCLGCEKTITVSLIVAGGVDSVLCRRCRDLRAKCTCGRLTTGEVVRDAFCPVVHQAFDGFDPEGIYQ